MNSISCLMCLVFLSVSSLEVGVSTKDEYVYLIAGHTLPFRTHYLQTPFIDLRPDEISTYNRPYAKPAFLRRNKRYIPEFHHYHPGQEQNTSTVKPGIHNTVTQLQSVIREMKTNIEKLYHRQNLIFSYVKCSNEFNHRCKRIEDTLSDLQPLNWNHFLPPEIQKTVLTSPNTFHTKKPESNEDDNINIILDTFKAALDEQKTRQNLLYKYIACAAPRTACGTSVIPALREAFKDLPAEESVGFEEGKQKPQGPLQSLGNLFPNNPFFNLPGSAGQFIQPISTNQHNNAGIYQQQTINSHSYGENVQQPINNIGNSQQSGNTNNYGEKLKQPILTGYKVPMESANKFVASEDEAYITELISEVWPETRLN